MSFPGWRETAPLITLMTRMKKKSSTGQVRSRVLLPFRQDAGSQAATLKSSSRILMQPGFEGIYVRTVYRESSAGHFLFQVRSQPVRQPLYRDGTPVAGTAARRQDFS